MENNKGKFALTILRTAILLFPHSDNSFNSYGEVLAKSGKTEEAIMMYKRSLQLNPKNEDSKNALDILESNNKEKGQQAVLYKGAVQLFVAFHI